MQFQEYDVLLLEEFPEHIRGQNAGHVAGSQNQAGGGHSVVDRLRGGDRIVSAHPWLQANVSLEIDETDRIKQVTSDREDGNLPTPVGRLGQPSRQRIGVALIKRLQIAEQQPQVSQRNHRSCKNLFRSAGAVRRDVLDLAGDIDPVASRFRDGRDAAFE